MKLDIISFVLFLFFKVIVCCLWYCTSFVQYAVNIQTTINHRLTLLY